MLNNYGSHYIDQLLYISSSKSKHVNCSLRKIASLGDAEDVIKIIIETENSMILDIDINMAATYTIKPWHILGDRGSIVLDIEEKAWKVKYFVPEEIQEIEPQKGLAAKGRFYNNGETIPWKEVMFQLSDFNPIDFYQKCYQYFAEDREPFVPISQSLEIMHILQLCRKDAESKTQSI